MNAVIVAYGDSHTLGVLPPVTDFKYAPYTGFLEKRISEHLKGTSHSVSVVTVGYLGEEIWTPGTELYKGRLNEILLGRPAACIVAVGTNNLGGLSVYSDEKIVKRLEEIAQNLFGFYNDLRKQWVEPIAVTVPPMHIPDARDFMSVVDYMSAVNFNSRLRKQFNRMLSEHSDANRILRADLFSGMAAEDGQTEADYRGPHPGDWLHYNEAGYERMADIIFDEAVMPWLDKLIGHRRIAQGHQLPLI